MLINLNIHIPIVSLRGLKAGFMNSSAFHELIVIKTVKNDILNHVNMNKDVNFTKKESVLLAMKRKLTKENRKSRSLKLN